MASQNTKYVDLTRTYVPMDPNSFPESLHTADTKEENRIPVIPYDARNVLPTAYGYKSYFGTVQELGVDALLERVDWILLFQNESMNNFLVALCDSGIWFKAGSEAGVWTHAITLPDHRLTPLVHYEWTFTVLNNVLYCYRENGDHFYTIDSLVAPPGIAVNTMTPTFLNMVAQKGIFKAGNRLGFWDSDNSMAWSTLDDKEEFTPDLETLAGNSKFDHVVGRIVNIKESGDDFIIYATKSVVHVRMQVESLYLWDPVRILPNAGIAYKEQVVVSVPDTIHFAYTNIGLFKISDGSPELIIPEVTDFFKLGKFPKYLQVLEGRYLFFQFMGTDYTTGFPLIQEGEIPGTSIEITAATLAELWATVSGVNPTMTMAQFLAAISSGLFLPQPTEGGGGGPIEA